MVLRNWPQVSAEPIEKWLCPQPPLLPDSETSQTTEDSYDLGPWVLHPQSPGQPR